MSDEQIDFAINEIYARHGLVFGDMNLRKDFLGLGWYKPKSELSTRQVEATFSKVERHNANALSAERKLRSQRD